jgi:hypothetical protein
MPNLVALAQQYVETSEQLETIRNAMRAALANGHGPGGEPEPHPTIPRSRRLGARPGNAYAARMAAAAAAETQILDLLKTQAMGPSELAQATDANSKTTADRLRRLRAKGLVESDENGWRAVAS